jgi:demethylmenaquinone methyltransferase/2-methoxy-6-polyprenyl-1,4-benzoquinol methylase
MTDANPESDQPDVLRVLQSKDEIRAYYDKIAKVYDLLAERSEGPMREAGLRLLAAQPGETIVEIGFGTGHSLVELARRVGPTGRVHGVDISEEMVTVATKLIEREGVGDRVTLWCQDASELPLDDHTIDAVFMSFTLELFDTPDIPRILAECRRVLRPGGRIGVVSISRENPGDVMMKAFEWTHRHFPNLLDCRPIYARRAVEAAGFEVVASDVRHMWLPVEIVLGRTTNS